MPKSHKNNGAERKKTGRPPKLIADDRTMQTIENLGKIGATHSEAAAVLDVTRKTFDTFLCTHKNAREAFARGAGNGKLALRRAQLRAALGGNPALLIWLGKQLLDQRERHELTGADGGPIRHELGISGLLAAAKAQKEAEAAKKAAKAKKAGAPETP